MINLIPKEEKRKIIVDFYHKFIILLFVMGSFSFFVFFVATLPSYFLSSVKNNIVNIKLETQKNEPMPLIDQQTLLVIKNLNSKLDLVENAEKNKFIISKKVINAVILKKVPNIKITDISYESDSLKGKKVNIQGIAPSREVLLSFRQALEDGTAFKQVDLPISNFVKGSNIQFYLSLVLE